MSPEEVEQAEQEISVSIETARAVIKKQEDMEKLMRTPEFNSIFIDGYMRDEAARVTSLLMDPAMESEEDQEGLKRELYAISGFRHYVLRIKKIADQMSRMIASSEATLESLRNSEEG